MLSRPINRLLPTAFFVALLALTGCARYPRVTEPTESEVIELPEGDSALVERMRRGVAEEFLPAVEAIITAVQERDNQAARGAVRALLRRGPTGQTLELARAFERILDGRQRVGWMNFHLEAEEDLEVSGRYRLELVVGQHGPVDLVYRPGGARLFVQQVAVDPSGSGQRGSRRDAVPFPVEIVITPDEELRFEVAELMLEPPAGVLAFSSRLRLDMLPGQFRMEDGRYLPAQQVPSAQIEIVRLAGNLPNAAIEPEELVSYASTIRPYVSALMERAVRIAPERRDEALRLLGPLVDRTDNVTLKQLVPALRWLAQTDTPGGSPEAWRAYMQSRLVGTPGTEPGPGLRLPGS